MTSQPITTSQPINLDHNRVKNYLIIENQPNALMATLGIMNSKGQVYKDKFDKFRQINKYLEMIDHIFKEEDNKEALTMIDFGSGKAYLTFAVYYYFTKVKKRPIRMIGLDLKKDVVEHCNQLAKKLQYSHLVFQHENIETYNTLHKVDMVMSLHACDTATDAAIVKGILWKAKYILAVPCCQHELMHKIQQTHLREMLAHGIVKDKLATLVTDTLRTLFLKKHGYETEMIEFIEMQHTPKNIMIKSKYTGRNLEKANQDYSEFKAYFGLKDLYIEAFYHKEMA